MGYIEPTSGLLEYSQDITVERLEAKLSLLRARAALRGLDLETGEVADGVHLGNEEEATSGA